MSAEALPAERLPQQRVPEFFIIGQHKSGTTALYEMLRRHPQIYMPELKEPRFFDSDLHSVARTSANSGRPETYGEYLALFEGAAPEQRIGEASASYLRSVLAASAIAAAQPRARCIAILREPASFVRSLHSQLVQEHVEREKDLRRAVAGEEIVRDGRTVRRYSDHIRYVEQLRRFHEAFPSEQVLVLIYDDFRGENEATVRKVLRFLEVDDSAPIEVLEANPSVAVRSLRMDSVVRGIYGGRSPVTRAMKGAVKALTPERVHGSALATVRRRLVYRSQEPADERLMRELRTRYQGEVVALSEYLDRDLVSLWGYDDLG
ncbi:MAG TPA: sulfotransferase [Solirubrobacteraceae bacterium]|nr:sulfotransferase [Solirubrobacteraceae bacterium]